MSILDWVMTRHWGAHLGDWAALWIFAVAIIIALWPTPRRFE